VRVIIAADTSTQPNAVMVKLCDTVVARVAVSRVRWPKNRTRLTILHPSHVDLIVGPVENSLFF